MHRGYFDEQVLSLLGISSDNLQPFFALYHCELVFQENASEQCFACSGQTKDSKTTLLLMGDEFLHYIFDEHIVINLTACYLQML